MKRMVRTLIIMVGLLLIPQLMSAQESDERVCQDSLCVPSPFDFYHPLHRIGTGGCDAFAMPLHEGFNAQFSLSAIMGMGEHTPSGVGFGRDVQMAYAAPLKGGLSYTLGASATSMDWGGLCYHQVGIGGSLNAAVSDKVLLTLTGYKGLSNPTGRLADFNSCLPWWSDGLDHYIGASALVKVSDFFYFQVSVGTASFRREAYGW